MSGDFYKNISLFLDVKIAVGPTSWFAFTYFTGSKLFVHRLCPALLEKKDGDNTLLSNALASVTSVSEFINLCQQRSINHSSNLIIHSEADVFRLVQWSYLHPNL